MRVIPAAHANLATPYRPGPGTAAADTEGAHALRATAATRALNHEAGIAKVQGSGTATLPPRESMTGAK